METRPENFLILDPRLHLNQLVRLLTVVMGTIAKLSCNTRLHLHLPTPFGLINCCNGAHQRKDARENHHWAGMERFNAAFFHQTCFTSAQMKQSPLGLPPISRVGRDHTMHYLESNFGARTFHRVAILSTALKSYEKTQSI